MIDVDAYLRRIAYSGPTEPTLETLRGLHVAHLLSVPFENIDIPLLRRPLDIRPEALFDKIVVRRRGGLCYELNGLFSELLRTLGFRVSYLSAAVAQADGGWGPPFGHVTLRVDLDEPWLADVGFGRDSFREPLRLDASEEQEAGGMRYRICSDGQVRSLEVLVDRAWVPMYRFDLQPHDFAEFEPMCLVHQTSPEAPFTRVPVAGLATRNGRITLVDRRLKIVADGRVQEFELADDRERARALRDYFGIVA